MLVPAAPTSKLAQKGLGFHVGHPLPPKPQIEPPASVTTPEKLTSLPVSRDEFDFTNIIRQVFAPQGNGGCVQQ